mgnify:CR=1 FL=1
MLMPFCIFCVLMPWVLKITISAASLLAITDMSDNANKMGTDMSMIQSAYQGFAKQNYTMLDNLKLVLAMTFFSASAMSVCSQGRSISVLPKWP